MIDDDFQYNINTVSVRGHKMVENVRSEEIIKRWDRFADTYAKNHGQHGDPHKEVLLNPTLFALMGNVSGMEVLDAGCGEGYLSRMISRKGAKVTAVDYSTRMLDIAKERTPKELSIHYQWGNCEALHFLEDQSFDLVVSNMVIQDLERFESAFQEIYRVLKRNGQFVFSILHPCFVTPESGWEKDSAGHKLYRKVDKYFYEGIYEQSMGKDDPVFYFHRTLTTYINTFMDVGFQLEKVIEPTPNKALLKRYPLFVEDFRCADFIVFKLTK